MLALLVPRQILAQTNYYWQTIANPTCASGGPQGVAVDSAGNIYVAATFDNTILKATPNGTNWVITTIAGSTGVIGTNDGIGSAARFNAPNSLALGGPNTLIVADTGNNAIRKISFTNANWAVTTIAGTGNTSGSTAGSRDGTNGVAQFASPTGVAANTVSIPEVVYVADAANAVIRKITLSNGTNWITTTIAGQAGSSGSADGTNFNAQFGYPFDVAMNSTGQLFVADYVNSTIRELSPSGTNWIVTTIAGQAGSFGSADGTNLDAQFDLPSSVKADGSGTLYVSDTFNHTIRKLTPSGTNWVTTTIGGQVQSPGLTDGTNVVAQFNGPFGVAVDSGGNVYVGDTGNNALRLGFLYPPILQFSMATNQITLFYPAGLGTNLVNLILQSTTNLANNSWDNVTNQWKLATNGTPYINLTLTNKVPNKFFRLELP